MQTLTRSVVVLALGWLAFVLFREAQGASAHNEINGSRMVMLFGVSVLAAIAAGGVVVVSVLPQIGESIGNFFFNPNEPVEKNPHASALAAMARGEYPRAIEEYRKVYAQDPEDTLALSEMARLYCEKLHEPAPAAEALESALSHDWPPEDAAFLSSRLVEVYWNHQHDLRRARELLMQIMETLPNSKHAANAAHRLQEIERQAMAVG